MYTSGSWSVVMALDAATGDEIWRFDPQVDESYDRIACCDVVNRGVALHAGKVYVGTLDGRLIVLDSYTGEPVWEAQTFERDRPYSITGAPRVVKGQVIIGNGGAEFGVRGYVSAYDAESGALNWRFYTVPGDHVAPGTPRIPPDDAAMTVAEPTWGPDTLWQAGGGGTAWDSFAYDADLDLLYVGVGNGAPWNQQHRDPSGGDNLFLASIVALDPDDGSYVWHYQTTPGETWDFTATQQMILADLVFPGDGSQDTARKVLMQAPKNGFFYVLDRATGELLAADNYVTVTWAEAVDLVTGRPIEAPNARYRGAAAYVRPAPFGGHNWQPMSFSPQTGLVYIPAWQVDYDNFWNGGTLATAGNLVFQGTAAGDFVAYRATDGELLWSSWSRTGILAGPISYEVDGTQYIAVMAGWGGAFARGARSEGRVFAFVLGGEVGAALGGERVAREAPEALEQDLDPRAIAMGDYLFSIHCAQCHGGGTTLPDLRYSEPGVFDRHPAIVLRGERADRGMPPFAGELDRRQVRAIAAWVIAQRNALAR